MSANADRAAAPRALSEFSAEELAEVRRRIRSRHEVEQATPGEGLRERKKRQTRQQISDTATFMFMERGFDEVRIAEVAAEAGVSEKTVYNYFPTKESLVLDRADEMIERLRQALAERPKDVSPTEAVLGVIEREAERYLVIDPVAIAMMIEFGRMVERTPALQAAIRDLTAKLVDVATEALAESAQVDPRDPEPRIAAKALVGLWEIHSEASRRRLTDGTPPERLRETLLNDTRRAARLLETGLWSFNSIVQGQKTRSQLAEAATAANEARKQVVDAMRQARDAWRELRRAHEEAAEGWFEGGGGGRRGGAAGRRPGGRDGGGGAAGGRDGGERGWGAGGERDRRQAERDRHRAINDAYKAHHRALGEAEKQRHRELADRQRAEHRRLADEQRRAAREDAAAARREDAAAARRKRSGSGDGE
ncbi:TetR/AcrR family transcriptional regulator [Patulibacter defluvii]|uniref:TetR/AcrR family transcriptional regulator n=1 Tax=Patulibacter defluvii TaxID=3095358 RepID=UPI002A74ACF7|nr:TetR family transcriptional regulator [Patulibacter sp. DM4]